MNRLWAVYIAIMMVCLYYSLGGQMQKRRCIIAVTVIMTLFSGFRSWWYGDLVKYYTRYLNESTSSLRELYKTNGLRNIGLTVANKFAYSLFGEYGYEVLLFLIALFSAYTLGKLIAMYSSSSYWSYLMYLSMGFYAFTLSGLKQTIAMSFCCLAMIALLQDNIKRFLIMVGLGALFHAPALVFLVAYPFSRKKFDKWYVIVVATLMTAMYLYRNQLVYFFEDAYRSEAAADAMLAREVSGVGGRFIGMMLIMMLAMMLRPLTLKDRIYTKVFNVMVLAAAFLFVPMFMQPITSKKEWAYRKASSIIQNTEIRLMLSVGITLFSIWFFNNQLSGIDNKILFFWEQNAHNLYWR